MSAVRAIGVRGDQRCKYLESERGNEILDGLQRRVELQQQGKIHSIDDAQGADAPSPRGLRGHLPGHDDQQYPLDVVFQAPDGNECSYGLQQDGVARPGSSGRSLLPYGAQQKQKRKGELCRQANDEPASERRVATKCQQGKKGKREPCQARWQV